MPSSSRYLRHLPEIFRPTTADDEPFLGQYLKIFEALLSGRADAFSVGGRVAGLDEKTAGFVEYLDPSLTAIDEESALPPLESEFLSYLAGWVALALDENWDLGEKREWLRSIVPLYKRRGTKAGLTRYLRTFVGNQVTLDELSGGIIVGGPPGAIRPQNALVGIDTFVAGAPAYYFQLRIHYAYAMPFDIAEWRNIRKGTRSIVDLEKPAHTSYTLDARTPGFIVGERATVSIDTLIWQRSKPLIG